MNDPSSPRSRLPIDTLPTTAEQKQEAAQAAQQAESTIEIGTTDDSGNGSSYDDSDAYSSFSASVTSSVFDYVYENGRRYHRFREGRYLFPNDDAEQERENIKHEMAVMLLSNKLHLAPISREGGRIVDLGTGTGAWAIAMGDLYPSATILGTDLSPIQPLYVPPNVCFMVDDVESPWLHPPNYFDYVHARHMCPALKDWNTVLGEAYDHLKPSGWVELQELEHRMYSQDGTSDGDYPLRVFWELVAEGAAKRGTDINSSTTLARRMREAGFINVQHRILNIPMGTWPRNKYLKSIGLLLRTVVMEGLQGIGLGGIYRGLGWDPAEVEVFLAGVRRSMMDNKIHSFQPYHVIYGQKPPV